LSESIATISLADGDYVGVARLVAAGVASRLDLGYETVDDLQLATQMLVRAVLASGKRATVRFESDESALYIVVGPATDGVLQRRLRDASEPLELRAVLTRLVDGVAVRDEPEPAVVLRVDLSRR
jgi:anti-sigma regulatory factor (Ser/Thr protein kinase)